MKRYTLFLFTVLLLLTQTASVVSAQEMEVQTFPATLSNTAPAQPMTGEGSGTARLSFQHPDILIVGQPVHIPITLNTYGQAVNGIQLEGIITGQISNVTLESASNIEVQVAKNESDASGFSLWLLPTETAPSVSTTTDTEIAVLSFVPDQLGTVTVELDTEATIIADEATSDNILVAPAPLALPVEAAAPLEQQSGLAEEAGTTPNWYEVYFSGSFLPLIGVIMAAVLGGGIYWWNKMRTQMASPTVVTPPTPPTFSNGVPTPAPGPQDPPKMG